MNLQQILSDLQSERARLDQAIAALEGLGGTPKRGPGRSPKASQASAPKRKTVHMSAAARKRIGDAKRKWWAQQKKKGKK
jgi:hypothetical protein